MKLYRWLSAAPITTMLLAAFWGIYSSPRITSVQAADETHVFEYATIYTSPTEPPIKDGVIVIRNGKIAAVGAFGSISIPSGVKPYGCKDRFITAGFQNSHVHFEPGKWDDPAHQPAAQLRHHLEDMLSRYGVTIAVDTGSVLQNTLAIRKRIESGEVRGPRILTAGGPLYPPDDIPYYLRDRIPPEIQKLMAQPETPEAAVKAVDHNLDNGADLIKLFTGSWVERGKVKPMPVEVAKAAVEEAHRRARLVFTHPSNLEGLKVALEAHVDVLAHAVEDLRGWDASYLARMKAANMALIPTLILFSDNDNIEDILKEVGDYQRAGGQILFGTDVGYLSDYSPQKEYELMARAGLTPMQILASLTTAPAERFGEASRRGRIAPGMEADLVVLYDDPAKDPKNFSNVCATYRAGRAIYLTGSFESGGAVGICPGNAVHYR